MFENYGVHQSHCCKWHGCKYGDENCPVVLGAVKQLYLCEDCEEDLEEKEYYKNKLEIIKEIEEFKLNNKNNDLVKFGDILYHPVLNYSGKENFINVQIVKEILYMGGNEFIISYDAFGQRWTNLISDLNESIFTNEKDAIIELCNKLVAKKKENKNE